MGNAVRVLAVMTWRQLKRYVRARSRLIGSIVNPLIWLVFFGLGWSNVFSGNPMEKALFGGLDYMSYLAPGVTMMAVFMASFTAGISVIWDREFGFLKEILVAPASREMTIFGRALGDSVTAIIQGGLILAATFLLAENLRPSGIPLALLAAFLVAFAFTNLGISIAVGMRSFEGFQLLMSFVTLPLIFLSGAFYPVDTLPGWMKALSYIDPLTYGVDLARYGLTGVHSFSPGIDILALLLLGGALSAVSAYRFRRTTLE